jgi:transposase
MDNTSIYHLECIKRKCRDAGVRLVYSPSYSPDFNPIEEFFAELKAFVKRYWYKFLENLEQGFDAYLE